MGFLGLIICTNRVCVSSRVLDRLLETKDGTHKISDKTGPSQKMSGCASSISNIISNKYKDKCFLKIGKMFLNISKKCITLSVFVTID
jgi:hypothetical protein